MKKTKLNNYFANFLLGTDGIFYYLQQLTGSDAIPWKDEDISTKLDLLYHGQRSGDKIISPLMRNLVVNDEISTQKKTQIAEMLVAIYGVQWSKLWDTLNFEYNPIENYSMTEKHTGSDTETQTPTDWKETQTQTPTDWKETEVQTPTDWKQTQTQTPTDWKTTTSGERADNEVVSNSSVYAFNSSDSVPVSSNSTSADTNTETTQSGTFETEMVHSGTFSTERERTGTYETETEKSGEYETETVYNSTLERSGNIGVTTSQQMIESERRLWDWNYFNRVFADIDRVLVLSIY